MGVHACVRACMYVCMYDSKPADGIALVARDICGMAWRGEF